MAFCAWCGNTVNAVSYAPCPRCGNPTNGAQRLAGSGSGGNNAGLIIGLVVGLFAFVAIIGILAAIAIPNMLTAMNRAKQKRTAADLRLIATAAEAFATDNNYYPRVTTTAELASALAPTYLKSLPPADGWGTGFRYECWPAGVCENYAISSAGADKVFERGSAQEYAQGAETTNFNADIVFSNGRFVQYPQGIGIGGGQ